MKLRVGKTKFGEVSDEAMRPSSHDKIRHEMVDDLLIDGIVRLIQIYQYRYGTDSTIAREKFLRALGITPQDEKVIKERKRNGKRSK